MFRMIERTGRAIALGAALIAAASAHAQTDYPRQPITFVVGASPGGPADAIARLVSDRLRPHLADATMVLDYKPGANGRVAGAAVAKATPDGHTLLVTAAGHAINPALYANMPYDPLKDLVPVAFLAYSRTVIAVSKEVPAQNLADLIALSKSRKEGLSFASGGSGSMSHLLAELFLGADNARGAQFTHVPYKTGTAAVSDLISGRVAFVFDSVQQMTPLHQADKLRIMAVTSERRWPSLPQVPTMKEAGFAEASASSWLALFAPARTPAPVLQRLNKEINTVLAQADVREALMSRGFEPEPMSLEQANGFVKAEAARWLNVVKLANIKAE